MTDGQRIAEHVKANLALEGAQLAPEYGYRHLPLCVLDAIFSTMRAMNPFGMWSGATRTPLAYTAIFTHRADVRWRPVSVNTRSRR